MVSPSGTTPLYQAMREFTNPGYAPLFTSPSVKSHLVVIVDGEDTCGRLESSLFPLTPDYFAELVTDLLASGIMTYLVSLGLSVNSAQFDAIADNGGTGLSWFDAQESQGFQNALNEIIDVSTRCIYHIDGPSDGALIREETTLFINNKRQCLLIDCAEEDEGWVWLNDSRLELCADTCDMYRRGEIKEISITDCNSPVIDEC
ncbi:MAG: VWA domain-containing protein [Deltaproteobacteria bacterium]|nr:VWA domain-containing protein [Deltaproteobacteria bacterium]